MREIDVWEVMEWVSENDPMNFIYATANFNVQLTTEVKNQSNNN